MAALRTLLARWRSDSGAEFVEAALALPLLLLVVLGIMDFGMMFQQYMVITNAAREGARVAVLPGYTGTDAQARAQQYITSAFLSGGGTPTIPAPTTANVVIGGNCITTVSMSVTYPHQFLFISGWGFPPKTLTGRSVMRLENAASPCP